MLKRWLKRIFPSFIPAPWDVWNWMLLALPAAGAALSAYAGYVQGIQWMWVIAATSFVFACVTTCLLRFSEWRVMRRVKDKLVFLDVRIGKNINGAGMALGFLAKNDAVFPIEFEIVKLKTQIGDQVPAKKDFDIQNFVISPGGTGWFDDHIIMINNVPSPGTLEGEIEFEIKYGRPGGLHHKMNMKKRVGMAFDENGILTTGTWNDAK